jgi:flagellar basal-body rod modification protein FlgD
MSVNSVYGSGNATERGTRIVKAGGELDKNSFLRILSAQLSNQDPMNASDSSQYVAQMAQFSSLEQMTNLNTTMTFSSANSLIGKGVALKDTDANGNAYTGIVRSVSNRSGSVKLNVEVNVNGTNEFLEFNYDDVSNVIEIPDYKLDDLNENMLLLTASTLIGKRADFKEVDENNNKYSGTVKGVFIEGNTIKLSLKPDNSEEIVNLPYSSISKVYEV